MSGVDWGGQSRQPCPACGRGPKDRTLGVTLDERGGVAHCHRCDYVSTLGGDQRPPLTVVRAKAPAKHETLSDFGLAMWRTCIPLDGTALSYLRARRCVVPPLDGDLRWHPALLHPPSGLKWPALVALVTDALTGVPLTLHRTWVQANGSKAPVAPPRMLLGGHRKQGGVIRLWPDESVTSSLAVAEGVETALSVAHYFQPVWSCIDAGNLSALPLLPGIERLVIAADNDPAGREAANTCASRWAEGGRKAAVAMPPTVGSDWNDEVMKVRA